MRDPKREKELYTKRQLNHFLCGKLSIVVADIMATPPAGEALTYPNLAKFEDPEIDDGLEPSLARFEDDSVYQVLRATNEAMEQMVDAGILIPEWKRWYLPKIDTEVRL